MPNDKIKTRQPRRQPGDVILFIPLPQVQSGAIMPNVNQAVPELPKHSILFPRKKKDLVVAPLRAPSQNGPSGQLPSNTTDSNISFFGATVWSTSMGGDGNTPLHPPIRGICQESCRLKFLIS